RKSIELVNLSKFTHQFFWRHTISDFPTCDMIEFPKRSSDKTSFFKFRKLTHTQMFFSVENDVFINFIAQNQNIRIYYNLAKRFEIFFFQDRSCGIVWVVDQYQSRFIRD